MKNKYLVIGGDGLVGSALVEYLKKGKESFLYTSRRKMDIRDGCFYLDLVEEQGDFNWIDPVDVVVFCAGVTKADACENDKITSRRINVENMFKLASTLINKGAYVIYLSSNAVFDGSKEYPSHESIVSPVTEYGRQKAEAENLLINNYPSCVTILRLTKILGLSNYLFDDWTISLRKGNVIYPFSDMYIAPIPVSFVISVIRLLFDKNIGGILHLSGDKDFSYAEIAFMASNWLRAKDEQIKPIHAGESSLHKSVVRTSKTALDISRLKCKLGITPPESLWTIRQAFLCPKNLCGAFSV